MNRLQSLIFALVVTANMAVLSGTKPVQAAVGDYFAAGPNDEFRVTSSGISVTGDIYATDDVEITDDVYLRSDAEIDGVLYSPYVRWGYQTVAANTTLTAASPTYTLCTNASATVTGANASAVKVGRPFGVRSDGVANVTAVFGSSYTVPANTTYVFISNGSAWKQLLP